MKIRQGFVSNSSSSSFHIFGAKVDDAIISKMMIDKGLVTEEDIDLEGLGEYIHLLDTEGLQVRQMRDWNLVYIGRSYTSLKDDETGGEFKADAQAKVNEFFGKEKKCEQYFETY